ncbi:MAG: hypothetical protein V7K33_03730 [Nostoc sp.]
MYFIYLQYAVISASGSEQFLILGISWRNSSTNAISQNSKERSHKYGELLQAGVKEPLRSIIINS